MSFALTNLSHSFVNTLVHIWTVVLSWCSFRHPSVVVDLEQGIQRPQDQDLPLPAAATFSSAHFLLCQGSNLRPDCAASSFPNAQPAAKCETYLPQIIVLQRPGPESDPGSIKPVDGRIVPTSLAVRDDMSASGTNPMSVSCDASGTSIIHKENITWEYKVSSCRSSISTSTSTPSLHVPSASFHGFKDDQNLRSSRRAFIARPLSPLTFPSHHRHGKGHKRAPLAIITNISHVTGPSSPVIETFTIPKPSSAIPLMPPMALEACTPYPTAPPVIRNVAGQITVVPPPRYSATSSTPLVITTLVVAPPLIPATPTSERSLRPASAFDNLHSPSPSSRKRPVSSVVWFKVPKVPPTIPLRIAKRAGLSPLPTTAKAAGKAGVTEEELEEEVLAVRKAFATVREEGDDDDGIAARERFNRASVWTTWTNRSSVFPLDEHMRNILDEEEDDDDSDDEGYRELSSSSLMMRSPPPPYPLSPPAVYITDQTIYKISTVDSLPPVSESTELSYLRSPISFSSMDESLDDLLSSFEDLVASMPSRLSHAPAEKEAAAAKVNQRVISRRQGEKGEMTRLVLEEDMDSACHGIVVESERARHWSDDFELDAYVETS